MNNYKIGDDFRKLCNFLEQGTSVPYPRVYFTEDELIDIKHITDSRYKAIQALMRTTVREDLLTGNPLGANLEDHHIFPYSLNKSGVSKHRLNSIVNRIIVSQETNRMISNLNPDKYLADLVKHHISEGNTGELDRRLANCFIPYLSSDPEFIHRFSKDNFDGFLTDRANMILKRIRDVVGAAWQASPASEEKNLEDDEFVAS
ncbi:MAG: hypothetical protein HY232_07780 [Acidobacteria bacterium]|nr:hypothetical protein [Acidobacteriota bacterium]